MYFLGYDIGSSSIKAAIIDASSNQQLAVASYPEKEMDMISEEPGWAEQHPEDWWAHACEATRIVLEKAGIDGAQVKGIGISYQMHGLVLVDQELKVLRPSIIWCDSRAVPFGDRALQEIGGDKCYYHLLNAPGNFTAAKLKWVKENEPELFDKVYKIMLPGDYIAMQLTGKVTTTVSGLSEGMFWDFQSHEVADFLMEYMGFSSSVIPEIVPTFGEQGQLTADAAQKLGLAPGTPIGYRAGDQPNNALSLGALNPGEIAATGGTSGVVYGVQGSPVFDPKSRVNSFAHVNHTKQDPRIGVLLCVNGAGIQYRYMREMMAEDGVTYEKMEQIIQEVPVGADGLRIIPFGNGAERILNNKDIGAHMLNVRFNRHKKAHYYRAALEGVAYSFIYGIEILKELGLEINKLRVGNDNLFQSETFSVTVATLANAPIEVVKTTGAIGAARAAGYATGHFNTLEEAVAGDSLANTFEPQRTEHQKYREAYEAWKNELARFLN
ncbi:xylulokinase [Marinoscillum furvescens]|uniref:Xylulokinase n=1 Tax=Marinoscillum furvescens DSM 4134 TaxID=1122208 RepID=A0A3D9L5W3_MARFU|nr:FGGY family carbohydrate kinase [Marinoscillum furvescens]REE01570.1 xylulokinase [Marinoscillum furvescens DSM 4134]